MKRNAICFKRFVKKKKMKQAEKIILAGGVSLLTVLGIIGILKFFDRKHRKYNEYYSDFHRHFENSKDYDDSHGVEFLSMR